MTTQVILPKIPSQLIRLALEDLAKVEAMPDRYEVNMLVFHLPNKRTVKCMVCFAGAVLSMSLNIPENKNWHVYDGVFSGDMEIFALNHFRTGAVSSGFHRLGIVKDNKYDRVVTTYKVDPAQFRADMNQLADDLEKDEL